MFVLFPWHMSGSKVPNTLAYWHKILTDIVVLKHGYKFFHSPLLRGLSSVLLYTSRFETSWPILDRRSEARWCSRLVIKGGNSTFMGALSLGALSPCKNSLYTSTMKLRYHKSMLQMTAIPTKVPGVSEEAILEVDPLAPDMPASSHLSLPRWGLRHHGEKKSHSHCALSELLTLRIWKHDKKQLLFYTTMFGGGLLCNNK